jgi:hypothetical protein
VTSFLARMSACFRLARRYDELMAVARSIKHAAWSLDGSAQHAEPSAQDPFDLLCAARDHLELAVAYAGRGPVTPEVEQVAPEPEPELEPAVIPAPPDVETPRREPAGPPQFVTDLIEVSDMLLMAANSTALHGHETFEVLYRRLGAVLEKEGVRVIDWEDGRYDPTEQEIVEVRPTVDAGRDGVVCDTVRPGYAFGDRIMRVQKVVVHQHNKGAADAR